MNHMTQTNAWQFIGALLLVATLTLTGCGDSSESSSGAGDAHGGTHEDVESAHGENAEVKVEEHDDFESLMLAYMGKIESLTKQFKSVTDEASAEKAAPKIHALSKELNVMSEQFDNADPMTKGMTMQKHIQRWMTISNEMATEMKRITDTPALAKHLGDAMNVNLAK